jgi:hypothetical protein
MFDNLPEVSAATFKQHIDELFAEAEERAKPALARGKTWVEDPITGFSFDSWSDKSVERAKHLACAALAACEWHRRSAPAWAIPLPVHNKELEVELFYPTPNRIWLLQQFGRSMQHHWWSLEHPIFRIYASSFMAFPRYGTREDLIREDRSLQQEFPPQKFVELSKWRQHWMSPAMIAEDKMLEERRAKMREQYI